eukprot:TRINITY_DN16302_c0_g1_i1.p1 TRINITY_DN16302_c0_g1~~TRINITY_DN16302_c0_g1_i1.p1  ORF type:complete len:485 (+),score=91.83 TRINITY_DN16302_c0_g1_i1:39-1493(+)
MRAPWWIGSICACALVAIDARLLVRSATRGHLARAKLKDNFVARDIVTRENGQPLLIARHMWASGYDAKSNNVPLEDAESGWYSWDSRAQQILEKHWRQTQSPPEGCKARMSTGRFMDARIDMEWGVTSAMRDVLDQLLYGLLTKTVVVFSSYVENSPAVQTAMEDYASCAGNTSWLEGCYFERITTCKEEDAPEAMSFDRLASRRTTSITEDVDCVGELKAIGAITRHTLSEKAGSSAEHASPQWRHAERLAMFRALLLRVVFKPNSALKRAIHAVERRAGLRELAKAGPVVAIHIRRTDKAKDFGDNSALQGRNSELYAAKSLNAFQASLTTVSDVLLPWLEKSIGNLSGAFVMSDDYRSFEPKTRTLLFRGLRRNATTAFAFDPESSRFAPRNEEELARGHETWGHRAEQGLQVLAEAFAAGRWANYVVGCGSSGVTQLMLQLLGGRLRVDPNVLGVFEDDVAQVDPMVRSLARPRQTMQR